MCVRVVHVFVIESLDESFFRNFFLFMEIFFFFFGNYDDSKKGELVFLYFPYTGDNVRAYICMIYIHVVMTSVAT